MMVQRYSKYSQALRQATVLVVLLLSLALLASLAVAQEDPPAKDGGPASEAPTIVGGQQASPGEWPWQVALVSAGADPYNGQFCGGSLIGTSWVVTAAHCVDGATASSVQVLAGIHDLANPESGYQRLNIGEIFVHPNWAPSIHNNDVALLYLSTPAIVGTTSGGEQVDTLALVSASVGNLAGETATITGWGNTGSGYPTKLREATVPVVTNAVCNASNSYNGDVTSNMLCAGYASGGVDTCQGDSGGPLVVNQSGWKLAGITSWGYGCAQPNYYGVYTRVANFVTWINDTMAANDATDPLEPNNNRGSATVIAYGAILTQPIIAPVADVDFYRFAGQANDQVIIDIDAVSLGSALDSYVELQSSNGTVLAYNDDFNFIYDSYLTFTLPTSGNYYIRVREYNEASEGGSSYFYTLKLSKDTGSGGARGFYVSGQKGGTVGGVAFAPSDIIKYDPNAGWSMYFDASDVGLSGNLNAFAFETDGDILMSFAGTVTVPGAGKVLAQDVVRFVPTSLGNNTSGTFYLHIDGSDVGLTTAAEKIDALSVNLANQTQISTVGTAKVNGTSLTAPDEDVIILTNPSYGANTSGTWSQRLDGSTIAGMAAEDVNGVWRDLSTGDFYVAIVGGFNLRGVAGNGRDIVKLTDNGNGTFTPSLFWDGSAEGFPVNIDGLEMMP